MRLRRRDFLRVGGLAGVGLHASSRPVLAAPSRRARLGAGAPDKIIQLVSDGMSMGTLAFSDHYSRQVRGRGLVWLDLFGRPDVANTFMAMRSLNSIVTDSSAASSSWGSGSRILNGQVNVLPDGRILTPLYELFGQAGWKRGLVTTTEITHATPAGFGAAGMHRDHADDIAAQYLQRGIEILLGGGQKFFDPKKRKDKRDLKGDFVKAGYQAMEDRAGLFGAPLDKPWLGAFAESHLPYVIDHEASEKLRKSTPTLVDMTKLALLKFEREQRFILQVEGGRMDHACHNCDAAAAVREQVMFDEALEACLDFQKRHPSTLIVITSDHGNGNPGLNGMGTAYANSSVLFSRLRDVRMSFDLLQKILEKANSPEDIRSAIEHVTGFEVSELKARAMLPFAQKKGSALYELHNALLPQLSNLLANHTGISYASGAHTSDFVPLTVLGPGADRFRGFVQNTQVFEHYMQLAGIDFRNPEVPIQEGAGLSATEAEFGQPCD